MRVALLTTDPTESHGWSRHAHDLTAALAAQGVAITLITARDAQPEPGLPVQAIHRILPSLTAAQRLTSLRLLAANLAVRRMTAGCEVVHVIAEPYTLAALSVPQRLIVTAHGTYVPQTLSHALFGPLYRRAYRRARLICVSSYTEKQVRAALPGAQTTVIMNGMDTSRTAHLDQPAAPITRRGPTILAVGQVKPRKGYHILTQAMPLVRAEFPDAEAVIIGSATADPTYVQWMHDYLAKAGQPDAVRLLGRVDDATLNGWYGAADVFALPALNISGRFEGFGLVYLEASAAGLPVVGTMDCGAEDAVRDGETGLLVPQNDPQAVADAIVRMLRDPELRARMGAAGRTFAAGHTWDRVARRVLDLYQRNA